MAQNQIETTTNRPFNMTTWSTALGWVAMLLLAFYSSTYMVAAGDTWVAMACGRHFVNHGVDTVEPFSANSHRAGPTADDVENWPGWAQKIVDTVGLDTVQSWHPTGWINQNWLTHVIFYRLTTALGSEQQPYYNALVWWKFIIYGIAIVCVYYTARTIGVRHLPAAALACFSLYVGRTFLDIRPAGFSNMLVALYILILVLATYRDARIIWFIVAVTVFWANVHGGYLYSFIMIMPFIGAHAAVWLGQKYLPGLGDKFITIGPKGIIHTAGAAFVMLIASIVFNPYGLTNFTHTYIISVSEHAEMWRRVNEWHPAFAWDNPVGSPYPFLVMFILSFVLLAAWLYSLAITRNAFKKSLTKKQLRKHGPVDWVFFDKENSKVDITLMLIAALTIYMAVRSRRFIPISAMVAAPVLALMLQQTIQALASLRNFKLRKTFKLPKMPEYITRALLYAGTAVILVLAGLWSVKFHRIYLGGWFNERGLDSVFMRMTASDSKPFFAMQFIRENEFQGKMFNYWTEGGFIAWAQRPDPHTGKTPLQLFMDGRAQAAYEPENYNRWNYIYSGGLATANAIRSRGSIDNFTSEDYLQIGQYIDTMLKDEDVWITMMPSDQFQETFVRAMEVLPNWRKVFFNNKQRIYVDLESSQGLAVYEKAFADQLIYPDEFSANLIRSKMLLTHPRDEDDPARALEHARAAFEIKPSGEAMRLVLSGANAPLLGPQIDEFTADYIAQINDGLDEIIYRDGGFDRLVAGLYALSYRSSLAQARGDQRAREQYNDYIAIYEQKLRDITARKRW